MKSEEVWERMGKGEVRTYTTAKELWERAEEYFRWCKENPKEEEKVVTTGKEVGTIYIQRKTRPYTIIEFCLFCGTVPEYLKDMCKLSNKSNEFYHVCNSIINIIKNQNIQGAMVEQFNPIFTAKILGLEREEAPSGAIKVTIEQLPQGMALSNSETQLLAKIEEEEAERAKSKEQ